MDRKTNFLPPTNRHSPWARPFWEGLSENKLLCQTCGSCGAKFFPPRPYCPQCLTDQLDWIELSDQGTLHSWTEVRVAGPEFDTPFFLGLVDLSEGIGRITAKIIDAEAARLKIGMPVRISYVDLAGDFTLYCIALD